MVVKETWESFSNCRKTYGGSKRESSGQVLTFLWSLFLESGKAFGPLRMFSKSFLKGLQEETIKTVKYLRTIFSIELCGS